MYLISESDRRTLEQIRIPPSKISAHDDNEKVWKTETLSTLPAQDNKETMWKTKTLSTLPAQDDDKTMDELHERYKRLIDVSEIPTRSRSRPRCRNELKKCKEELDKCMKIVKWQTIDGASYIAPPLAASSPIVQPRVDLTSPLPFLINNSAASAKQQQQKQKTPRPKRQRKEPSRFLNKSWTKN